MIENVSSLPAGFIRLSTILKRIPVGKSTWWAKVKSGEYPKAYKLANNTTAWKIADIKELMESFPKASCK